MNDAFFQLCRAAQNGEPLNGHGDYDYGDHKDLAAELLRVYTDPEARQRQLNLILSEYPDLQAALDEADRPPTFPLLSFDELMLTPPKRWLIDGFLGAGDLGMLFGAPGGGKSFVAIDLVFAAVLGQSFAGKLHIGRPLKVAFATGEGQSGLKHRFTAAANKHQCHHGQNSNAHALLKQNLIITPKAPQLYETDIPEAINFYVDELKATGVQLDLLVIDTLHNATLGADENSARDMGKVLGVLKAARESLQCAVLLIHHTNKQGTYRGSSALHGAADAMFQVKYESYTNFGEVEPFKLKDAPHPEKLFFQLQGDEVAQSAAVQWLEHQTLSLDDKPRARDIAKEAICRLLVEKPGLSQSQIVRELAEEVGKHSVKTALAEMREAGEITIEQGKHGAMKHRLAPRLIEQYSLDDLWDEES